jgi:hypothetical protein
MLNEIQISSEELLSLLTNPKRSGKNEYVCTCPFCNKPQHFYIGEVSMLWECKKCKETGNVYKLLKHLGVLDQYLHKSIKLNELVRINTEVQIEPEPEEPEPECKLPLGFNRIFNHEYLNNRGFVTSDYYRYKVGVSKISKKLKDYIIFLVEELGVCKGYVGRCVLSKKEIEERGLLRYRNSSKTKFNNLLYGFDEITKLTTTVIIVEGIFDKIRLDRFFKTDESEAIRVLCSFGNKMSDHQINKLKQTNVGRIILFYDLDAINEMKTTAPKLSKNWKLRIACLDDGKDPDEASDEDLMRAFENTYETKKFFIEKCNGRKLKAV